MQLGPYDGRKKRSRCVACAASHLKCSSSQPCTACTRRGMACTYPARQSAAAPVIVESAWTTTSTVKSVQQTQKRALARVNVNVNLVQPARPSADPFAYYLHHFYAFVRRNDFTGKAAAVHEDLQQLSRVGQATYLRDAMLAIGAMHAANMGTNDMPDVVAEGDHFSPNSSLTLKTPRGGVRRRAALEYYASAVSGLSRTLAAAACDLPPGDDMRDAVLWTTLFLGFYELMNETPPGEGWRLHMVHGTGKALRASGAACCRRGRSRTFFLQARVFEVFRAIVCSDATFLTEPEWTNLLEEMWVDGAAADKEAQTRNDDSERGWHPLDALLDVVAQCTKLRFRIRGFLAQCRDNLLSSQEIEDEGTSIASRAVSLRNALERWSSTYGDEGALGTVASSASTSSSNPFCQTTDASMILAHVFCAAANAYLSGIFDYEMDQWHAIGQQPPTLSRETLQLHVDTILRYAAPALANTNIAPILLLFPIRIAGARSRYPRQRTEVLKLLDVIGRMYAAATYYSAHLQRLWVRMAEEELQMELTTKASESSEVSEARTATSEARTEQAVIVTEVTT